MIKRIMKWVSKHILLAPFMVLLFAVLLSCKSTQYVPIEEKVNVRDSTVLRDSTVIKDSIILKDSVIFKDSTVLFIDPKGNIIKSELYKTKEVYRELQSRYNLLVEKYNKLLAEKSKVKEVPYPVERDLTRWEQIKMDVGGYAIVCGLFLFFLIICIYVYKVRHRNRNIR